MDKGYYVEVYGKSHCLQDTAYLTKDEVETAKEVMRDNESEFVEIAAGGDSFFIRRSEINYMKFIKQDGEPVKKDGKECISDLIYVINHMISQGKHPEEILEKVQKLMPGGD